MALLHNHDACESWRTLLTTVTQMVDWVHLTTSVETFNSVISPKIQKALATFSGTYVDQESSTDLSTELAYFLMEHYGWNGQRFERGVDPVDLLSALKSFRVTSEKTLGKGAYARVFLARNQLTGETVVHKHVTLDSSEHGLPLHVLRELAILKKMRHPHIVRYDSHGLTYSIDFRHLRNRLTCQIPNYLGAQYQIVQAA
jgi:Protein kinase domain